MMGDPTWCSHDPAFIQTSMLGEILDHLTRAYESFIPKNLV